MSWPGEWLRGVLEMCILTIVGRGPVYGYAIAAELESAGLGTIKGGTLYPILARCEQAGFVEVEWRPGEAGPGRKYYTLTDGGHRWLAERSQHWREFARSAESLLTSNELRSQT